MNEPRMNRHTELGKCKTEIDTELKSLDTRTFSVTCAKFRNMLEDDNVNLLTKYKIVEYFTDKIYMYYKAWRKFKQIMVDIILKVFRSTEFLITAKMEFILFKESDFVYDCAKKLFYDREELNLGYTVISQFVKFMLRYYDLEEQVKIDMFDYLEAKFEDPNVDPRIKMDIADIYLLSGYEFRGHQMLEILRQPNQPNQQQERTVYQDSQNVHDGNINKSVLDAAQELVRNYCPSYTEKFDMEQIEKYLGIKYPKFIDIIKHVIDRIKIDTANFGAGISLYQVFAALWRFISVSPYRDELTSRLVEEMISMDDYCSTGHLARFINVIQGFTDDERLQIRISEKKQIWAVVSTYLNKIMADAPEDVADSMTGDNTILFKDYIFEKIKPKITEWIQEYGQDAKSPIIEALQKYTIDEDYWNDKKISLFH